MARRKNLVDVDQFEVTSEDLDFQAFIDEVGAGSTTVDIYRCHRDGRRGYVERIDFAMMRENAMEFLRERYGAGKYQLGMRDSSKKILGHKTVEIEDLKPAVNGSTPGGASFEQKHIELLREQAAQQQTLLMTLLASNKGPDLGTMMTGMAAMMGAIKPQSTDPATMLAAVVQMFTTMRGPAKDEDWLDRAKTIIGLARDLVPDNREENMWSVVKDVGKEVVTRLQLGAMGAPPNINEPAALPPASGQVTFAPAPQAANPVPRPAATPAPVAVPSNAVEWIKAGLNYLKDKARRGRDPKLVLDWIMENPEEPQWAALLQAIHQGASYEHLLAFDAEIAGEPVLAQWFRALYDDIHGELHQSMDSTGAGRNPDNAGDHEDPGAAGPVATGNPKPGPIPGNTAAS